MKKIFTLLTAILLCSGMVVQAQLLDAVNDSPEGGIIPAKANLVKGRNNAPQTDWYGWWSYADEGNSVMNTNGYGYLGALGNVKVYRYQWDSDLQIYFAFTDNSATWTSPISGATVVVPARGSYTVTDDNPSDHVIGGKNTSWDGNGTRSRYVESGKSYYFNSATWYVAEGVDGPYIYTTNLTIRYIYNGYFYNPGGSYAFKIGEPAVYKSVTVQSENTSKGTISKSMKSGYVYTTNITDWKEGSTYTISASPQPGYQFDHWSDGGAQSHDITITGDATYTAYFAPAQYSITYKDQGNATFTGAHESGYPTTHTYGTATTLKSAAKADYTFDGWYTDQNCTGSPVASLGATAYTSNITLYAKWTYAPAGSTYTLLLDKTGNGTVTVRDADNGNALVAFTNNEAQVTEGHNVSITASPAAGYHLTTLTFADEPVDQNETYEMSEDNITLVAVFEPDVYTITYRDKNNQNFSGVHGSGYPTSHTYGTATALVNPTKSGAVFGGWYTSSNCTGDAITSLGATAYTSAPTVYAKWINDGTITTVAANGTVTGGGNYTGGTNVQLSVTANDGYIFTQWSDDNTDNPRTVYVDGDATYTAQFVQGVRINVEMGRLGVYNSNDFPTMADGSGNSWFHIIGKDGEYEVRFESYGKSFTGGQVYGTSDVDQSNTWLKRNGVNVPLNFSDISATATLNRTYGGKYGVYDISIRMVGTDGKVYLTTGQTMRAISFDTADDYAFPKMDYNFGAPSYRDMIPEDYGPNSYTYTADGDGKWLYLKQSISGVDYYLRLCFKVAGNSIPTGTYHLNATGSGIPVGTAIPTILYDMSATGNNWPNEVNGSCVFVWEQTGDENAYWWFLEYGTINVVNTNGVYYVEVDAINSFAEPVRFTMGTPPVTNHTVSITAPTNGTITVSYNDGSAQSFTSGSRDIKENTVLTITAEGATGYHFDSWTNDGAASVTVNNDKTIGATFAPNAYTVTFNANGGSGESMASQAFTYGVAQNLSANTYTAPENKHFIGWATTAEGDVAYAAGAEVSNLTSDQNGSVELFAKWAYNTYTVVFNKNNESAIGSMAAQAFTYGTAQNLTTNGFTLSGHDFAGWATEENGAVVYTNGEEVNNLTSVHEGTVNLYAKWIEIFVLRDDKEAGDTYYTTTYANKKAEGKKLNVQYNRSFTAGRWATFALPFGYSFRNRETLAFGGEKRKVYYLISAEYTADGYLTLNCMPVTDGIRANQPYILIPGEDFSNPVFEGVKLQDIAENPYTASDISGTGTIKFVNTTYRQRIDRADADENLRVIFLKSNTLYYPGGAVTMSAFRGYFYMMDDYTLHHGNQNAPVRVRLMTPDGEYIEQAPDTDQPAAVETKKYIENGILVIERAGMKYDAQGHIIN